MISYSVTKETTLEKANTEMASGLLGMGKTVTASYLLQRTFVVVRAGATLEPRAGQIARDSFSVGG